MHRTGYCLYLGQPLRSMAMRSRHHRITNTISLQGIPLERIRARKQKIHCHHTCLHPDITLANDDVEMIMENVEMTIKEAQQAVDQWIREYGVRYFSELTNMAVLTEEVGELARVMARKYGDQSFKEGEKDNIADEMADVLWVLICLAKQTGTDLTEAFRKNIEKKTDRDKFRHKNNPKL